MKFCYRQTLFKYLLQGFIKNDLINICNDKLNFHGNNTVSISNNSEVSFFKNSDRQIRIAQIYIKISKSSSILNFQSILTKGNSTFGFQRQLSAIYSTNYAS